MTEEIVKLGLIGHGNWGKNYVSTMANFSRAEIKTIATRSNENDWHDLCKDDEIQGVIIATPPATHYEMAKFALENGKHIIVEKPFVYSSDPTDIDKALEIEELAAKKGLNVVVGNVNLFNPAFREMVSIFQSWEKDSPVYINSSGGNLGPFKEEYPGFVDYVPHNFAMLLDLVEDREFEVSCIGNQDQASARITFDSGECMITTGSLSPQKSRSLIVVCGKNYMVFNDLEEDKLIYNGEAVDVSKALPLNNLIASFVDAIRSGERMYSAEKDVMVMHLVYTCLEDLQ